MVFNGRPVPAGAIIGSVTVPHDQHRPTKSMPRNTHEADSGLYALCYASCVFGNSDVAGGEWLGNVQFAQLGATQHSDVTQENIIQRSRFSFGTADCLGKQKKGRYHDWIHWIH